MTAQKRFRASLETEAGSFAYVKVPFDVKAVFGKGRPPVRVTLNGYPYRSTLAPYGGVHYLVVNRTVCAAASVKVAIEST